MNVEGGFVGMYANVPEPVRALVAGDATASGWANHMDPPDAGPGVHRRGRGRVRVLVTLLSYFKRKKDGGLRVLIRFPDGTKAVIFPRELWRWGKFETSPQKGKVLELWVPLERLQDPFMQPKYADECREGDCFWRDSGFDFFLLDGRTFSGSAPAVRHLEAAGFSLVEAYEYLELLRLESQTAWKEAHVPVK